jgi:hypothetical protein
MSVTVSPSGDEVGAGDEVGVGDGGPSFLQAAKDAIASTANSSAQSFFMLRLLFLWGEFGILPSRGVRRQLTGRGEGGRKRSKFRWKFVINCGKLKQNK